jgi:hypothetical protein
MFTAQITLWAMPKPQDMVFKFDNHITSTGWQRSSIDPNLYVYRRGKSVVILLLYVDDLLITGNDPNLIDEVKRNLMLKYRMKDLGIIKRYLSVDFVISNKGLLIHQSTYAQKILQDAGMQYCKPVSVPLPLGFTISENTETPLFDRFTYCHIVGQLLYLTHTRPDISYSVNFVSRFMSKLQEAHWRAVLHILRYISSTIDFGILYRKHTKLSLIGSTSTSAPVKVEAFTDSDWAACKDSRRSTGGYLFVFAGGSIDWSSKRQGTVSMSTTEAEYRALAEGAKEAVHLKRLLEELNILSNIQVPLNCSDDKALEDLRDAQIPTTVDITLNCDNISAIKLARNPVFHARSKHIELHCHYIRE